MTRKFAALVKILLVILSLGSPVLLFKGFVRERGLLHYRHEIVVSHEEERRRIVGDVAFRFFSQAPQLDGALLTRRLPTGPLRGLGDFPPPDQVLSWGGITVGPETRVDPHLLQLLYDEGTFPSGMPCRYAALVELYRAGNGVLGTADFGRFYQVAGDFWRAEGLDDGTFAFLLRRMPRDAACRFPEQMRFLGINPSEEADHILVRLIAEDTAYLLAPSGRDLAELNNRLQAFSPGALLSPRDAWRAFGAVHMTLATELTSVQTPIKRVAQSYLFMGLGIELVLLLIYLVITRYEKVHRIQKRLMATTSHELRTPLAVIRQFAEMLLDRADQVPPRIQKYHRHIHRESMKMQFLVENLLSAARVENLKMTPDFTPIPLQTWLTELRETAAGLGEQRVTCSGPEVTTYWDRTLMSQVLTNIMENARVHAGTDMEVTASLAEDRLTLACRDFGNTPDLKRFQRIRPFYSSGRRGLGLGLYLSRRIVKLHHGHMRFEDARPGLRVVIDLPVDCRPPHSHPIQEDPQP